jgi:hypothetical protein
MPILHFLRAQGFQEMVASKLSIGMNEDNSPNCITAGPPEHCVRFERSRGLSRAFVLLLAVPLAAQCSSQAARAQFAQQGPKLVSSGADYDEHEGASVALSADGRTAIVGGPWDTGGQSFRVGASWVYTRTGNVWSQQGGKLVGSDSLFGGEQGSSVALSSDGNTAIIGGPTDGGNTGAVWVFTRSNGVWTQQGSKLVPSEIPAGGNAWVGASVALSADGNTAIIGVPMLDGNGGSWVFTRSAGVWAQQSGRLLGSGNAQQPQQGTSVAISADGNTAIVGGPWDGNSVGVGGAWIFVRSAGVWTQQGSELVGTGSVGPSGQGRSVGLSADGNTAFVGGPGDNGNMGAVWVYTRSHGVWTQQGNKLIGAGTAGGASQGASVASSAGGNMLVVGGPTDNSNVGAAWVFTRTGNVWSQQGAKLVGAEVGYPPSEGSAVGVSNDGNSVIIGGVLDNINIGAAYIFSKVNPTNTHDVNADGVSDILWRFTDGTTAVWVMNGAQVAQSGGLGTVPTIWQIVGQRDFNGDGHADLLWHDTSGNVAIWEMNGTGILNASNSFVSNVPTNWSIVGTGDFNGDGAGDLLWQDRSGNVAIWEMNGTTVTNQNSSFVANVPGQWSIVSTGDFNGDSMADILWQDTSGNVAIWEMNGTTVLNQDSSFVSTVAAQWSIKGTGDFNGDGKADILWQDTSGNVAIWEMNGTAVLNQNSSFVGNVAGQWSIQLTGDYNGDGMSDILWQDMSGNVAIWEMNGTTILNQNSSFVANVAGQWSIQHLGAE